MKKNILVSLAVVGVLSALIVGGTGAVFFDEERAVGNVFVAGTLDLKTDGTDGITGKMTMTNMYPGQVMRDRTIILRNAGTINAGKLSVTFSNVFDNFTRDEALADEIESFDGPAGNHEFDMSRELIVTNWRYGATDLLAITGGVFANAWVQAADANNDDVITLYELERQSWVGVGPNPLDLTGIAAGANVNWIMNIRFDTDATNALQGDSITTEIRFELYSQ